MMDSQKLEAVLKDLLEMSAHVASDDMDLDDMEVPGELAEIESVITNQEAELLTNDNGLVIRLLDGSEYCLKISRRK